MLQQLEMIGIMKKQLKIIWKRLLSDFFVSTHWPSLWTLYLNSLTLSVSAGSIDSQHTQASFLCRSESAGNICNSWRCKSSHANLVPLFISTAASALLRGEPRQRLKEHFHFEWQLLACMRSCLGLEKFPRPTYLAGSKRNQLTNTNLDKLDAKFIDSLLSSFYPESGWKLWESKFLSNLGSLWTSPHSTQIRFRWNRSLFPTLAICGWTEDNVTPCLF